MYAAVYLGRDRSISWAARTLVVLVALAVLAVAPAPAQSQMLCGLVKCAPDQPSAGGGGGAAACPQIGDVDLNPANAPAAPRLDTPLIDRRPDGRVPWGFTDPDYTDGTITVDRELRLNRIAGSNLSKVTLHWGAIERERGHAQFDHFDDVYCALVGAGIRPLFMLYTSPKWAVPGCSDAAGCIAPPANAYLPDLRRFAEQLAIRYPKAAAVEVWNEPNRPTRWPKPDPVRYTQVLKAVFQGVNDGNPDLPVLGGAMSVDEADKPDGTLAALPFLDDVYAAGGGAYMDAVSLHAYPRLPQSKGGDRYDLLVGGVRDIAARYDGPGRRHIWVSETGGHVVSDDANWGFTEQTQADNLIDIYQRADAAPDVDAVIFHKLMDTDGFGWVQETRYSDRYRPRPVFCRFANLVGQGFDCSQQIRF
jgi:hypothetical protein